MQINKNPYVSALLAGAYIMLVVFGLNQTADLEGIDGTFYVPMFMLSFFVFSAAIMSYFFVMNPVMLYLDGHKKEAVSHFLKTLGTFALWLVVFGALVLKQAYL